MIKQGTLLRTTATTLLLGFCVATTTPSLHAAAPRTGAPGIRQQVSAINIVPVITSLQVVNGQLLASGIASGVVRGQSVFAPFSNVPVTLSVAQAAGGAGVAPLAVSCPILNLQLGPIHLDLLGLVVDTSQICLDITAMQGGGLLGDLLCGVANLLNGPAPPPLGGILAGLTTTQLNNLLLGLTAILNGALANLSNAVVAGITPAAAANSCDILNLTLGPLDLNLLGLEVTLNNCADGPVTVDITGQRGALLGNLLCGLLGGGGILNGTTLNGLLAGLGL